MRAGTASRGAIYPVVDLFAGPGGLGEGFSAFVTGRGQCPFDIHLSIEKEPVACDTLRLRKFFRSFDEPPDEYAAYVRGEIDRTSLYASHPQSFETAKARTWQAELGKITQALVYRRVRSAVGAARFWVLLGGPPCQAYSVVGRSRMKGSDKFESDERHFLYREYLRIVANQQPPVFVMENVKGLLSSTHAGKSTFDRICADLRRPGRAAKISRASNVYYDLYAIGADPQYELEGMSSGTYLLQAEDYGVPQTRHRVFIVGVRHGLRVRPERLTATGHITASEVLDDLPPVRSQLSRERDSPEAWNAAVNEVKSQQWYRAGPNGKFGEVARIAERVLSAGQFPEHPGGRYIHQECRPRKLADWYRENAAGVSLHETRAHMRSDLWRYLFCSCFAAAHGRSPHLRDVPAELYPEHQNVSEAVNGQKFGDRFRVQVADKPSTTVTSHIAKDGHYFIHYEPQQCRSLTVREAARLQTFPDSYFFEGNRTDQFLQIGNAVPPLLARSIARVIYDLLQLAKERQA